ncbi:major facilitator superfamily domain-containing protein [Phascolomyces articulosus]|uniref:Major facilitator superfamily domain-containing protein n=1 Tax=Phascolomyces articulosus TaxID=60185 RepID=A0AAD5P706_9FUNG|nr:major facilitator superfamily domain-containing protein [Phascolomyces articulosus]
MSRHQSITISTAIQSEVIANNNDPSSRYTGNDDDDDDTETIQEEQAQKKGEIKGPSLQQHEDSDEKATTIKPLPRTTTDKPWYNIELINIGKKEHILDPRDYSMLKKSLILAVVAFSATVYFPAMVDMQQALNTTDTAINASLSVFTFVTAFFPLLWTMLSERFGRRPVYLISFFICFVGNICCAVSVNIGMFIAFRAVSAMGSSSIMSMGAGTIADVFEPHQRGRAFAYYSAGALLGPALSPIIGGYLNEGLGWRSTFWFLAIFAFCVWLGILLILPETKRPYIEPLEKVKEEYSNNDVHNDKQQDIPSKINNNQQKKKMNFYALLDPLKLFRFPNITLAVSFIGIVIYNYQYGFDSGTVGLCYLALAGGAMIGSLSGGRFSDMAYKKQVEKTKNKDEIRAEMRLSSPIFYAAIVILLFSFIAFGWCIQKNVHFAAGLVCIFFCMLST